VTELDEIIDEIQRWQHDVIDVTVQRRLKLTLAAEPRRRIGCRDCAVPACCRVMLYAPLCDALPAARRLRRDGRDTPEMRARLREVGDAMEANDQDSWFEAQRPCVFLDGPKCSIYQQRPVECRRMLVASPAEWCLPPRRNIVFVNTIELLEASLTNGHQLHGLLGLKETPRRLLYGAFPRLVLIALEATDPGVEFREHVRRQRWPTVDDLARIASIAQVGMGLPRVG
jgi:Fe-S-cluster containining protein